MFNNDKATTMAESILDYIYEEGKGEINYAEALGILELVKFEVVLNLKEEDK